MTTVWNEYDLERRVREILSEVPGAAVHHLGRPYLTTYQIAIGLDQQYPEVARALRVRIGGQDSGAHFSLASYLGRQLTDLVRRNDQHDIEGALLSNQSVKELSYLDAEGRQVTSSLPGSGFDMSMFRLRG